MQGQINQGPPSPGRKLAVLPAVALVAGLLSTMAGWWVVRHWVEAEASAQMDKRVEILHGELMQRLSLYDHSLHAAAGFISLSDAVSVVEWAGFVDNLGIGRVLTGIPALAYAPLVRGEDVEKFVQEARADGLADFHLWPSADAPLLVPNRLSAPMIPANVRALGYDMYQNPMRRLAMDAARDSGSTAVTEKITLTVDAGERNVEPAVIAYTPVYGAGLPLDTVEHRRAALRGFTLAPIRIPTLLREVTEGLDAGAAIRLHDGGAGASILYATPGAEGDAPSRRRDIAFSNRSWTVDYSFPAKSPLSPQEALPYAILVAGLAMTALLVLVLRSVVNLHGNAVRLAQNMTVALRDSEAKFKAVFDNSVQYQSLLDVDGRLISANPAALALVGGDIAPIAGKLFWEIEWLNRPEESVRLKDAIAQAALGERAMLNVMRDHNGHEKLVAVSFQPVLGMDGKTAWIVAEGRDLTEWRRREEALSRAVDALTRSNQELERFAHVAAHDLQEPCRTIVSYAQLLERRFGGQLGADGAEFLHYLAAGAHRMRDLVNDLLAYSQVKGRSEPFAEVDCGDVLEMVLQDMRGAITESGARLAVGPLPTVAGDRGQLAQLFQNLISNALKFREPGVAPVVTISASQRDGAWLFCVADNGIGIAPDYHHRVFDIFQRLHGADRFPGTGIGLAICRKVVERHGGRIWVDSAEGQGARFCFTVPAAG